MSKLTKYSLSLLLFFIVHLALLELFTSAYYLFYFLTLCMILYFLNLYKLFVSNKILLLIVIYMLALYFIFTYFEDNLYDLYIDTNMTFELSYISLEVCFILTVIHIFILFLLGYNRDKLI